MLCDKLALTAVITQGYSSFLLMLCACNIYRTLIYRLVTEILWCVIGCSVPSMDDNLPDTIATRSIASHMPQSIAAHVNASHNTDVQPPETTATYIIASHNTDIQLPQTSAAPNVASNNADVQTPQASASHSVASVDTDIQVSSHLSSSHTGKTSFQHHQSPFSLLYVVIFQCVINAAMKNDL